MNPPPIIVGAASREQEQARAAFKRRADDITNWLATWPNMQLGDTPPGGNDVHGQQNIVLHAQLDGRPVVVKVYADTDAAARCAAAEAAALDRYATFGLPVPQVIDLRSGLLADHTPCTVVVLAELPGRPLSADLPNRDPTVAADAGTLVGRLLALQHRAERLPVTSPGVAAASWQRIRERYEPTLIHELGIDPDDFATMGHRAAVLPDPTSLGWVTFDWRLRHLLWDGTTVTGLVDLEYTKPYDSAVELANLLHDLTIQLDPPHRQAFAQASRIAYEQAIAPDDRPTDDRLLFWMARQAFSHAAVKHWQGVHDDRITQELRLTRHYLDAASVDDVLHIPTPPPRSQPTSQDDR